MPPLPPMSHAFSVAGGDVIASHADPFEWWSITKSVLAAAMMRLAQRGEVVLDAPFHGRAYTLRQLLNHTAGVTNYGGPAYQAAVAGGETPWSVEALLTRRRADTLMFEPGEDWDYSNIGYLFIRQELERVTGQTMNDALRALVFEPLGMAQTRVAMTPTDLDATHWGNPTGYDPNWVYHGLLIGPPGDAVRFLRGVLGPAFLRDESRRQMCTRYDLGGAIEGRPWSRIGYGLGLMMGQVQDAGPAIGHSGVGPGTVSALYAYPELPGCPVACAFAQGGDEAPCEWEALRLARAAQSD